MAAATVERKQAGWEEEEQNQGSQWTVVLLLSAEMKLPRRDPRNKALHLQC